MDRSTGIAMGLGGIQKSVRNEPARELEDILELKINIPAGIRSIASTSHNSLRDFLRSEHSRDSTFPLFLEDSDFLGGSFARHTKIWPLDDIDIYFAIDGWNLNYINNGTRLPFTVEHGGARSHNPVCGLRWSTNGNVMSSELVDGFASVLQRHFPLTEVRAGGQSVCVQMTHGSNEESDGLGYDIVPCFSLRPDNQNSRPFYLIPDGHGSWIRTNPKLDLFLVELLHDYHNKLFRKIVKLVKYWNQLKLANTLASYYIELAVIYRFLSLKNNNQAVTSLSEGLAIAFDAVASTVINGDLQHFLEEAPAVKCAPLSEGQKKCLEDTRALAKHARLLEVHGNENLAARTWEQIFDESK